MGTPCITAEMAAAFFSTTSALAKSKQLVVIAGILVARASGDAMRRMSLRNKRRSPSAWCRERRRMKRSNETPATCAHAWPAATSGKMSTMCETKKACEERPQGRVDIASYIAARPPGRCSSTYCM